MLDIHILYHIVLYSIVFIPLALYLRRGLLLLLCLIILPIAGEYIQQASFLSRFNFFFEYFDMLINLIGSLIGIGIAYLMSSLK